MFAVSLKEVEFPVEKQNLYVRNNLSVGDFKGSDGLSYIRTDYLSYVGECLINMEDHTIYKIGKRIRYTPTQDLIEQVLTEYGKFNSHIIYYAKNKSAVCINLILQNHQSLSVEERYLPGYKFALEICNYYSGRYSPKVTLSLYNVQEDMIIRTPISAFDDKGEKNIEGSIEVYNIVKAKKEVFVDWNIIRLFPVKYATDPTYLISGNMTLLTALNRVAEITNKWLETNYELATTTQKKIYNILLTKTIEE